MWTKEKPTVEGYYWVRAKGVMTGKIYIHPVRVYSSKWTGPVDTVFSDGENFSIDSDMFIEWFSEQIQMPEKSPMTLRERFTEETGKCCALDRRRECSSDRVFSDEYVEWLEKLHEEPPKGRVKTW